jgi:hypothetical protein
MNMTRKRKIAHTEELDQREKNSIIKKNMIKDNEEQQRHREHDKRKKNSRGRRNMLKGRGVAAAEETWSKISEFHSQKEHGRRKTSSRGRTNMVIKKSSRGKRNMIRDRRVV